MKIYTEQSLADFKFWSGAEDTAQRIWEELGREGFDQLEVILEDVYPDGIDETELNDLLWFDAETVYEWLGIGDSEDKREKYQEYLEQWYANHSGAEFEGMQPALYDEWLVFGDEEDDEENNNN